MSRPRKEFDISKVMYMLVVLLTSIVLVVSTAIVGAVSYEAYMVRYYQPAPEQSETTQVAIEPPKEIVDGKDVQTGLIAKSGYQLVKANCTACHSAKIITQNAQTREGWKSLIVWMQETQDLWDLGDNEDKILDYLAANYAPEEQGRRAPLKDIKWYILEVSTN